MKRSRAVTLVASLLLVACLGLSVGVLLRVDRLRAGATLEESLYLSSSAALRRLSLGYSGLMADIYWTRAVQYFGRKHFVRARNYDLLFPLLDITSDLDPHLLVVYEFGAAFLAQPPPDGAGRPDKAVELIEKGIRQNPDAWRLYYELGFVHALERRDYAAASAAFMRGSERPGAHPWLKILAAEMAQRGGDPDIAEFMWRKTLETTEIEQIRDNARLHLLALRVDKEIRALEEMIWRYRQRAGHWPESWAELVQAGQLRGTPLDPRRKPYRLGAEGQVYVVDHEELRFIQEGIPEEAANQPVDESNR